VFALSGPRAQALPILDHDEVLGELDRIDHQYGGGLVGKIFDDPMVAAAMLDRLLHGSVVFNIDGGSYRMRTHRARSEKRRKGVTKTQTA